jgi:hypothetical protein
MADDAALLAGLLRSTGETSDVLGFLRGLHELGNVDLDRSEIRRALSLLREQPQGAIADLMLPTRALRIRDGKVQISRSEETLIAMGTGALKLGRRVQFKLRANGNDTTLSSPRGIRVGETADSLYSLKNVVFTQEGGRPVAKVTAGVAFFSRTLTVPLPEPAPLEVIAEANTDSSEPSRPSAAACRGLLGALSAATASTDPSIEPQLGDRGDEIADLQRKINADRLRRGLEPIDEDGIFGRGTSAALNEFKAACD